MKTQNILTALMLSCLGWTACKKDVQPLQSGSKVPLIKTSVNLPYERIVAPNAFANIREAQKSNPNEAGLRNLDLGKAEDQMYYVQIDYTDIDSTLSCELGQDSSLFIFDFPFDNKALYDEAQRDGAEQLADNTRDGYGYAVLESNSPWLGKLSYSVIDTFLNPNVIAAYDRFLLEVEANKKNGLPADEEEIDRALAARALPATKQPKGYVKYQNSELGDKPVKNVSVWAIWMGMPVIAYTNSDGYFNINANYAVSGTLLGLKYRSNRYRLAPLDARGNWISNVSSQVSGLISGAISDYGWVSKNNLPTINMQLRTDNMPKAYYWSHILTAINYHDQFTTQEQIYSAPNYMNIYAIFAKPEQVDKTKNGTGNTYMYNYINAMGQTNDNLDNRIYDMLGVSSSSGITNLINVIKGQLSDQLYKVTDVTYEQFSCRFMKVALHELSHASRFRKMGSGFWISLGLAQVNTGATYGEGPPYEEDVWVKEYDPVIQAYKMVHHDYLQHSIANSQLEEAWCEFLAQDFARRIYSPATAGSASREYVDLYNDYSVKNFSLLKESEHYFVSNWIPKGAFNDFMDVADPVNEPWDNISGFTIKQLWDVFDPFVISDYHYRKKMVQMYPSVTEQQVQEVFSNNKKQ